MQDVGTRQDLAARLQALRARSGHSFRSLAKEVGGSSSTISGWCNGRNLPFPAQDGVFEAMLLAMGVDDPEPWMQALARVRQRADGRRRRAPAPYPGLHGFGIDDADRFFGRDDEVRAGLALLDELAGEGHPTLLVVVGPSGVGKSSLLHAGLARVRREQGHDIRLVALGDDPLGAVTAAAHEVTNWPQDAATDHRPLVVVDQVERVLTRDDTSAAASFGRALLDLATEHDVDVAVGLRVDAYAEAATRLGWRDALTRGQLLLEPLAGPALEAAVVEPARRVGVDLEAGLLELLRRELEDAGPGGGALPLLSHALRDAWEEMEGPTLTAAAYRATGGLESAVASTAERAYAALAPAEQDVARALLLRLVRVRRDGRIDAHPVARAALLSAVSAPMSPPVSVTSSDAAVMSPLPSGREALGGTTDPDMREAVVEVLVRARILRADSTKVALAHESVVRAWPRLSAWMDDERDQLERRARIGDAAHDWIEHERDDGLLARGARLAVVEELRSDPALGPVETAYVEASLVAADERAARRGQRVRRLRVLAGATSALALAAAGLAAVSLDARSGERDARALATSRYVAVSARDVAEQDVAVGAQLAVGAHGISASTQATSALLDLAARPIPARLPGAPGPTALAVRADGSLGAVAGPEGATVDLVSLEPSMARTGSLALGDRGTRTHAMAFAGDDVLVVGTSSGEVQLWDVSEPGAPAQVGEPVEVLGGQVETVAVAPDGSELAVAGSTGRVVRLPLDGGRPDRASSTSIPVEADTVWELDYHPDGAHLAASDDAGRVHLWQLGAQSSVVAEVGLGDRRALSVAISPDGGVLAGAFTVVGNQVGRVAAWDISDVSQPRPIDLPDDGFPSFVNVVDFAPDGRWLVAGSQDGVARVWVTETWTSELELAHPGGVTDLGVDTAGHLTTAAVDGTTRRLGLPGAFPTVLDGRVFEVGFTDDGSVVAVFSGETVAVWRVDEDGLVPRLGELVASLPGDPTSAGIGAIRPDGSLLARASLDGELRLYRLDGGPSPRRIAVEQGDAATLDRAVAFGPSGARLAAGSADGSLRLWDVADADRPSLEASLSWGAPTIENLEWHPGGLPLLAAASADSNAYLLDVADMEEPQVVATLAGLESEAFAVAFRPDGEVLAVAGNDGVVHLWDVTEPDEPERVGAQLTGPLDRVFKLDFAPDGEQLHASVQDGTLWTWDVTDLDTPARVAVLGPTPEPLFGMARSPTSDTLVASGGGGEVRVWTMDPTRAAAAICDRVGTPLGAPEWTALLADTEPHLPCG